MQVGKESDHAVASATIHALVVLLQVLPQRLQALIGTIFLGSLVSTEQIAIIMVK